MEAPPSDDTQGRGIMLRFILSFIFSFLLVPLAIAQQGPEDELPQDELRQLLCEMAVGNLQGDVQEAADLYVQLYAAPDAQFPGGKYGLLTGNYYGDRGVSQFGPTLDDPAHPRYFEDGTKAANYMAAALRANAAAERQARCDLSVNPL